MNLRTTIWPAFAFTATLAASALPTCADSIQARWTRVDAAAAYALGIRNGDDNWRLTFTTETTSTIDGADRAQDVTVAVWAMGEGCEVSAPSNTIVVPADMCQALDIDGDGSVTASDVLRVMTAVVDGECE